MRKATSVLRFGNYRRFESRSGSRIAEPWRMQRSKSADSSSRDGGSGKQPTRLMLNTIDTIIAFAVIMTILSLLITVVVQMISAALSLRGKNLANALALTFQMIDPKIGDHAHSLAAQILRDPISVTRSGGRRIVPRLFRMRKRKCSLMPRKR